MSDRVGGSAEGVGTARDAAVASFDGKDPNVVIDDRIVVDSETAAWARRLGKSRGWPPEKALRAGLQSLQMFLAAEDLDVQLGAFKGGVWRKFEMDFGDES